MSITLEDREQKNRHRAGILWFTGLSGAGKTTLARALEDRLFARGAQVVVLDGDVLRQGLSRDLGFSPGDRLENVRRAGEVAALFAQAGFIVIAAFITPLEQDRDTARASLPERFHLVHVSADLTVCEKRDVKGLYKKARAGEIPQFTGISAPYEIPRDPSLTLDTGCTGFDACMAELMAYVEHHLLAPCGPA